jgi:hypothetical protein
MKAKLIKKEDDFYSLRVDGIVMATSNGMLVDYKLSKQNCDEIFGVVNVEKLAEDFVRDIFGEDKKEIDLSNGAVLCFIRGFNKAMELQKDKLYTIEDVKKAIEYGIQSVLQAVPGVTSTESILARYNYQQSTEIEVEIEMECCGNYVPCNINCTCQRELKLDKDGCLILKKL